MKKANKSVFLIGMVVLTASCTTTQLDKAKVIAKSVGSITYASLPIIAKVATAYGAPYAELVTAFASVASPGEYDGDESEDYEDSEDFDYSDESDTDESYSDDSYADGGELVDEDDDYGDDSEPPYDIDSLELKAEVNIVQELAVSASSRTRIVRNGDTLNENDNYKIQVSCNTDCYTYIAQLDATGKMTPIIPGAFVDVKNPLRAEEVYSIPGENNWFFLDKNVGLEQVYFVIAKEPREDIERVFQRLMTANQNLVQEEVVNVEEQLVLTRGIGGIRKGRANTVVLSDGEQSNYPPTLFESNGEDLVLTRWFVHE